MSEPRSWAEFSVAIEYHISVRVKMKFLSAVALVVTGLSFAAGATIPGIPIAHITSIGSDGGVVPPDVHSHTHSSRTKTHTTRSHSTHTASTHTHPTHTRTTRTHTRTRSTPTHTTLTSRTPPSHSTFTNLPTPL
ncbi:hypothetical protein EIP91_002832 [Steccherinum ochraceum]|uniref:Uncharacterized protein n=1 Tax=Steccherinum ochraceum TaxID=92696 RepID=A0A4R0RBE0_9APHY|nr:hypothetical protein EIP91_002832 [Steccherinum ochraceum]